MYLWGFAQTDYTQNTYIQDIPTKGLEYFVIPNKYEKGRAHIAIYNWDSVESVQINISNSGLKEGEQYELINAMDYYNDTIIGTYTPNGIITVPMAGHTFAQAVGSKQIPFSQFPKFGAFVLRKKAIQQPNGISENTTTPHLTITPNPSTGIFSINNAGDITSSVIFNILGEKVYEFDSSTYQTRYEIDLSSLPKGIYFLRFIKGNTLQSTKIIIQ
ncbi:MAG: T9SS type A sorting domain-containing protein [Bacteroidetes bacterium]|nr:T9SS type A sorting domain-containing protein [Bacteroidota bacterium]